VPQPPVQQQRRVDLTESETKQPLEDRSSSSRNPGAKVLSVLCHFYSHHKVSWSNCPINTKWMCCATQEQGLKMYALYIRCMSIQGVSKHSEWCSIMSDRLSGMLMHKVGHASGTTCYFTTHACSMADRKNDKLYMLLLICGWVFHKRDRIHIHKTPLPHNAPYLVSGGRGVGVREEGTSPKK
jgi:hypothetical protein